jgi:Kef-type K+ transport system membrane component KefB
VLQKNTDRLVVGVGMIPRGEVGLIFAQAGLAGHVIQDPEYVAILIVVMVTTFVTPPLLKMVLKRKTQHAAVSPARQHASP